jgi:hypothetical protein
LEVRTPLRLALAGLHQLPLRYQLRVLTLHLVLLLHQSAGAVVFPLIRQQMHLKMVALVGAVPALQQQTGVLVQRAKVLPEALVYTLHQIMVEAAVEGLARSVVPVHPQLEEQAVLGFYPLLAAQG